MRETQHHRRILELNAPRCFFSSTTCAGVNYSCSPVPGQGVGCLHSILGQAQFRTPQGRAGQTLVCLPADVVHRNETMSHHHLPVRPSHPRLCSFCHGLLQCLPLGFLVCCLLASAVVALIRWPLTDNDKPHRKPVSSTVSVTSGLWGEAILAADNTHLESPVSQTVGLRPCKSAPQRRAGQKKFAKMPKQKLSKRRSGRRPRRQKHYVDESATRLLTCTQFSETNHLLLDPKAKRPAQIFDAVLPAARARETRVLALNSAASSSPS